ncbi:hypothetical protein JOC37_002393 [Desulfohalotomaculum tongense]|nr:hypothetical protein [Desulforadius tongensis]
MRFCEGDNAAANYCGAALHGNTGEWLAHIMVKINTGLKVPWGNMP